MVMGTAPSFIIPVVILMGINSYYWAISGRKLGNQFGRFLNIISWINTILFSIGIWQLSTCNKAECHTALPIAGILLIVLSVIFVTSFWVSRYVKKNPEYN